MIRQTRNQFFKKGTTFIEILLYAGFLTIILGLLTNFLYQAMTYKVNNQISATLFQNSQAVATQLTTALSQATSVIDPVDTSFTNQLILDTDAGPATFDLSNGILRKNSSNITDNQVEMILNPPQSGFRRIGSTVQIKFSLKAKLKPFGLPQKVKDYQVTIFLVNEQN